jgi:hypothetical protein
MELLNTTCQLTRFRSDLYFTSPVILNSEYQVFFVDFLTSVQT